MGHRTIKCVPLDFDWPLSKVWDGYVGPQPRPCPAGCENGSTVSGRWLETLTHLILMAGDQGVRPDRALHPWLQAVDLAPERPPGPDMADLTTGLAGRPPGWMGHDAIDRWGAVKAIVRAAGLPESWGTCPTCEGHACHPEDRWMTEDDGFTPTEPPVGDGWQLWETTSEGSPVSPVFDSAFALAAWCVEGASPFGSTRWSYDEWVRFIGAGDDNATLMVIDSAGAHPLGTR